MQAQWVRTKMLARHRGRQDWWRYYHSDLVRFIRAHYGAEEQLVWVEVGTAFGGTTNFVLSELPHVVAHAVDPCRAGYDRTDGTAQVLDGYRRRGNMTHDEFSNAWAAALVMEQREQKRACRYHLHRKLSTEGAADFADASIDVLFVDGLHTYEGVLSDLEAYWRKLKPRSLLILNDWKPPSTCRCADCWKKARTHRCCPCAFTGVRRAGCEFLASKALETRIIEEGPVGRTNAAVVIGMQSPLEVVDNNQTCGRVLSIQRA